MSLGTAIFNANPRTMTPIIPRKRALVVDDSETILHAICSLLEHHEVVEVVGRAENGPQTIESVLELKPDLVILDADMPGMSGLRTALRLSQMQPRPEIILMVMDADPQFREACRGCGANAVIYKPKFLREISALLKRPLRAGRFAARV